MLAAKLWGGWGVTWDIQWHLLILAAPIDDLWHRLFGLDVTLWSPPHLLGLLGSQVNSAGCLLLAAEAYPADNRARSAPVLLGGALFFGGFHLLLGTSILWAYQQGGLAFFYYPILGALLLPVTLLPVARLEPARWTPALTVVLAALLALAAGGVIGRGVGSSLAALAPAPRESRRLYLGVD